MEKAASKWGNAKWLCVCSCGNKIVTVGKNLRNGDTRSCGCLHTKRELGETRFHNTWNGILQRTGSPKSKAFKWYGARGIKCLWKSYEEFKRDMYGSYKRHFKKYGRKNTTIDRINNDGNYEKTNCRWATRKQQVKNRRKTNLLKQ